jgi:hypothetical protein
VVIRRDEDRWSPELIHSRDVVGAFYLSLGLLAVELTVVVAPFEVLGLSSDQSTALQRETEEMIRDGRRQRTLVPSVELERARLELEIGDDELGGCLRDALCASRLARAAGADELIQGSAAGLGRTYVLRLALINAERSVIDREVQGTVVGDLEDLTEALPGQLDRLLPTRTPWYSRWWVWTIVGVTVAAVAVATALALALPDNLDMDIYHLP